MRACVETCGCTLNFGEARELEDLLLARGWGLDEDHAATLWFIQDLAPGMARGSSA